MVTDISSRRRALLAETEHLDPHLSTLVEPIFSHVATEDLLERSARDLLGAVGALRDLAAQRAPGHTLVHVFTPTLRENGWTSRRTIVGVCTDDSPFLVDSITAAIASRGYAVHLLVHPILAVTRDGDHTLVDVDPDGPAPGGNQDGSGRATGMESWMYLEIDRLSTADQHAELTTALQDVLGDVRRAVEDWRPMRQACLDIVADLKAGSPATVDPETVTPTIEFLAWLADDNFTFLGYREYELDHLDGENILRPLSGTGLGILQGEAADVVQLRPEAEAGARVPRLLTVTKANSRATVHRDAYLDYIGVRTFDAAGTVTGERRMLGLFTSTAYAASVADLPIVGAKVSEIFHHSGLSMNSHSGKDLFRVLETYPRDELFQDSTQHLTHVATEVVLLAERRRTRLFLRTDEFGRFVSALVYLPRDQYNTTVRLTIEQLLRDTFGADTIDYTTQVSESALAQLHFVVRLPRDASVPHVDEDELNTQLLASIRTWQDRLVDHLQQEYGDEEAAVILDDYSQAFPTAYTEATDIRAAAQDIERLRSLVEPDDVRIHLSRPTGTQTAAEHVRRFTMVTFAEYPLTQVLPVLTALGVDVTDERPYPITRADGTIQHISDFGLTVSDPALWGDEATAAAFEDAFYASWTGAAETDTLGSLVLIAGAGWRDIVILRALGRYLRQGGTAFSMEYIEDALLANADLAAGVVELFHIRFDPDFAQDRAGAEQRLADELLSRLDEVASLDDDRIFRSLIAIVQATWRTNFYVLDADGNRRPWLSMKIDCSAIPNLPKPHPMAEIWVYSPQLEGVHLRFGEVARGGLRWSDRREDFRTEVLGLVKAQMVKNAVIVPSGAKGGFVAKELPDPSDRSAWMAAGERAYCSFIRGLLDVTDNRIGDQIVTPPRVVRHDAPDPYLVVAADKGTAAFSDTANEISREYDFWLDDAFASGGSDGYDHKSMGITARGAWESTKRHFRELGHDTQTEDFTVVGIGDMGGDVFGNGMRQSRHIRLLGAFDHRHVFIDPQPDAAQGYAERERLYQLPRSSWADYDPELISTGGGVFERTAKSVPITPEMRTALGIGHDVTELAPSELIRALLRAPADLLYNGGIGTYIKASTETHADIGDRASDSVRIDGDQIRARVVVEGGNLGASQSGRIEAAQAGVRINTDAIDNSAGVGSSDAEVNLKLLFTDLLRDGTLTLPRRNELLEAMTDDVAAHVLRDNYVQNVLIGNSRANAAGMLPLHQRLMWDLQQTAGLDRELEFLPDDHQISELLEAGRGLTRPEFAVVMAYAKLALKHELAATNIAQDPWYERTLIDTFPPAVREEFGPAAREHPLRDEIIINTVANTIINRGGVTFAYRAGDETGAGVDEIARAFTAAAEIFALTEFTAAVEATDNVVSTADQSRLYLDFRRVLDRASRWFLQHRDGLDITAEVERFAPIVGEFRTRIGEQLHGREYAEYAALVTELTSAGMPPELAQWGAGLLSSVPLLDIVEVAHHRQLPVDDVAAVYYALTDRIGFADLLAMTSALPQPDRWASLARSSLRDDLYRVMVDLTISVLAGPGDNGDDQIRAWLDAGGTASDRALQSLADAVAVEEPNIATVSVALRKLRSLVR